MQDLEKLNRRTAWLSVISNAVLVLMKLAVGLAVGAVSLISEALHSGIDLLAALIAFWAVRTSALPPDAEHDYGHGKFENLSAAVEAVLILGAALGIVYEAIEHFQSDEIPSMLGYGIGIMLFSIVLNFLVSRRLLFVAHRTGSQALEADGLHLQADIWTSVGVLAGLVLMQLTGWAWLDPVIAIFVAGIIFRAGWGMVRRSVRELTDESLPEALEEKIGEILRQEPEVKGYHCLRTRRAGAYRLVDVHVQMDGNLPLSYAHAVCDALEQDIREQLGAFDILIHAEPVRGHSPESKQDVHAFSKLRMQQEEN